MSDDRTIEEIQDELEDATDLLKDHDAELCQAQMNSDQSRATVLALEEELKQATRNQAQ